MFDLAFVQILDQSHVREFKKMKRVMQNVVLIMEPNDDDFEVSMQAGNMCLNRFCIDEDAAFESTGVYYLKELREEREEIENLKLAEKSKGSKKSIMIHFK